MARDRLSKPFQKNQSNDWLARNPQKNLSEFTSSFTETFLAIISLLFEKDRKTQNHCTEKPHEFHPASQKSFKQVTHLFELLSNKYSGFQEKHFSENPFQSYSPCLRGFNCDIFKITRIS